MTEPTVDLAGLTEIGEMLGVSKQRAAQLTQRPDFPPPVSVLAAGRIWRRDDVEKWAKANGRM